MTETTIVLADDHPVVRQGLRTLLEAEPGFRVVGEAGDGFEAVRLVDLMKPAAAVVDLMMPGLNGTDVVKRIARVSPRTRVLVLSLYSNEGYVADALAAGAAGYAVKDSSASDLVRAVTEVARGRRFLSSPLSERAIEAYMEKLISHRPDPYKRLTSREREVLQLAAEGHTNAQIAGRLQISARTVEGHRANLMRKLGLTNQTALVRFALSRGILP